MNVIHAEVEFQIAWMICSNQLLQLIDLGTVSKFMSEGVDFSTYVYILEIDSETGKALHEREDPCHILKRICRHMHKKKDHQGFDDAMQDPKTGMAFAALTGKRKQSVVDAERMLSYLVASFHSEHVDEKGEFVRTVAGWDETADG